MKEEIISAIKKVRDPELPVDICELGLIYGLHLYPRGRLHVIITLTSPNCPAAEIIPRDLEKALLEIEGIEEVKIEVTFSPPYDSRMMSEVAKYELDFLF